VSALENIQQFLVAVGTANSIIHWFEFLSSLTVIHLNVSLSAKFLSLTLVGDLTVTLSKDEYIRRNK